MRQLTPWNWFQRQREDNTPVNVFQKEMNQLFDAFFRDDFFEASPFKGEKSLASFTPAVNISETEKELEIKAELPGVEEKDIQLQLDNGILTLRAERHAEKEEDKKGFYRREIVRGSFFRSIPLPVEVDAEHVKATFRKGVLDVKIQKKEASKPSARRITVQSEA